MEKSSFFNSVDDDRMYQASDFAAYFNSLIANGVFPNPNTNLQVVSNDNMTVTVKVGKAWINGYCYINDSDLILPINVADGILNRIDRVAIRFDTIARAIFAVVITGSFASSPTATILQRDNDGYELGIADVLISKGATSISQANITDLRMNTELCGWVNSLIQADTTAIFNQYQDWFTTQQTSYNTDMAASQSTFNTNIAASETQFQADFTTWFNTIKDQLGSDLAGSLQNQIDSHLADETYQVAAGTANAITVAMGALVNGYPKTFIASANNHGSITTINTKQLYKPGTTIAPTLILGKAYTVWYNLTGDCFFIKASSVGNLIAAHALANENFSNDIDTDIVGTMVDRSGTVSLADYIYADGVGMLNLRPKIGYYNGVSGTNTQAYEPNFIAPNLLAGKSYFGLAGSMPYLAGTITPTGVAKWGDGALAVYSPKGYNKGGAGDGEMKVSTALLQSVEPNLIPSKLLSGNSYFGVTGTATIENLGGIKWASASLPGISDGHSTTGTVAVSFVPNRAFAMINQNIRIGSYSGNAYIDALSKGCHRYASIYPVSTYLDFNISTSGGICTMTLTSTDSAVTISGFTVYLYE